MIKDQTGSCLIASKKLKGYAQPKSKASADAGTDPDKAKPTKTVRQIK